MTNYRIIPSVKVLGFVFSLDVSVCLVDELYNCTVRFFVWLIPNIDLHLPSFHSDSTRSCHNVLVACVSPTVSEHVTIKELHSENSFHNHRAESQII